jgi:hypothetical protein
MEAQVYEPDELQVRLHLDAVRAALGDAPTTDQLYVALATLARLTMAFPDQALEIGCEGENLARMLDTKRA